MKTMLSILCCFAAVLLFTSCNNGDSGSGARGHFPRATYTINGSTNVTCNNVDENVRVSNTLHVCTWNCAIYYGDTKLNEDEPRWVRLTFSSAGGGSFALTKQQFEMCKL